MTENFSRSTGSSRFLEKLLIVFQPIDRMRGELAKPVRKYRLGLGHVHVTYTNLRVLAFGMAGNTLMGFFGGLPLSICRLPSYR
jgi:hypothetical protein